MSGMVNVDVSVSDMPVYGSSDRNVFNKKVKQDAFHMRHHMSDVDYSHEYVILVCMFADALSGSLTDNVLFSVEMNSQDLDFDLIRQLSGVYSVKCDVCVSRIGTYFDNCLDPGEVRYFNLVDAVCDKGVVVKEVMRHDYKDMDVTGIEIELHDPECVNKLREFRPVIEQQCGLYKESVLNKEQNLSAGHGMQSGFADGLVVPAVQPDFQLD